MKLHHTLIVLAAVCLSCGPKKNQENNSEKTLPPPLVNQEAQARIDSVLQSFVASGNVAGVSALVFEHGEETYFNAFGYADREDSIKMARNTLVQIYSMTKPVTGVALMTLHEEGKFKLDDPVSKYAPEFSDMQVYTGINADSSLILEPTKRDLTIRDLTRHTAGLLYGSELPVYGKKLNEAAVLDPQNTLEQMASKMAALPLSAHPGEKWEYGVAVDLQAYLVEKISGRPYGEYLQEKVLDPLGMDKTRYYIPEEEHTDLAVLYQRTGEGQLERTPDDAWRSFNINKQNLTPGGHGLTAPIDDYMKFAQMLVNKGTLNGATILKPETVELMSTNQLADSVTERMFLPSKGQMGFGIDFAVRVAPPKDADENRGSVGEFFWDGMASTVFWVDPKNELTAVLFVQLIPYDQIGLHRAFREAIYGKDYK